MRSQWFPNKHCCNFFPISSLLSGLVLMIEWFCPVIPLRCFPINYYLWDFPLYLPWSPVFLAAIPYLSYHTLFLEDCVLCWWLGWTGNNACEKYYHPLPVAFQNTMLFESLSSVSSVCWVKLRTLPIASAPWSCTVLRFHLGVYPSTVLTIVSKSIPLSIWRKLAIDFFNDIFFYFPVSPKIISEGHWAPGVVP